MLRLTEPEIQLTQAVDQARASYLRLCADGALPPDAELARSQEYQQLLRAGRQIRSLATREGFRHTVTHLFKDNPDLSQQAARDLEHLWAGMIDWPDCVRPQRLN